MVSFKWLVWMLKDLLCLKDIKSVSLPNVFPEIHIQTSEYLVITNTISALHLWLIEAVNDACFTCGGFLGVQCFHIHVEISTDYIEEEVWWIVVFLDCVAWPGNRKTVETCQQYCACKNIQYITLNCVICMWLITVHVTQSEFGSDTLWSLFLEYLPIELK